MNKFVLKLIKWQVTFVILLMVAFTINAQTNDCDLDLRGPQDQTVCVGKCATFTVEPAGLTYQWYVSTNNGDTWNKLECPPYSGCENNQIEICDVTYKMNGYLYKVEVTKGDNENCEGICTYTQGGWGSVCSGNNPGCIRDAYFDEVFPEGLKIGGIDGGYYLLLTSSEAVANYLPDGSTSAVYTENRTNPEYQISVLSGQLVALKLGVMFGAAGKLGPNTDLGNMVLGSGAFSGMTVYEFMLLADKVMGGTIPLGSYSLEDFNSTATALNEKYDNCIDNGNPIIVCECTKMSQIAKLTVNEPPYVECPSEEVCEGEDVELCVEPTGVAPFTYEWWFNGQLIDEDNCLNIESATKDNAGVYTLIITNECGSFTCDNVVLTVNEDPEVEVTLEITPEDEVCDGIHCGGVDITATFTANIIKGEPVSYQWYKDGEIIEGETNSTLVIGPTNDCTLAGYYNVLVTNSCGEAQDGETLKDCQCVPVTFQILGPNEQIVCEGGEAEFCVVTIPVFENTSYQWFKNDLPMEGETNNCLTLESALLGDNGAGYNCIVKVPNVDPLCPPTELPSDIAYLTVNPKPVVSIADVNICKSEECGVLEAIVDNLQDVEPVSYIWSNGSTDASIRVCEEGEYCVTVYSKDQCMGTACGSLMFYANPVVSIADVNICKSEECGVLEAIVENLQDVEPVTYLWSDGSTDASIKVCEEGEYCVTVYSKDQCIGTACGSLMFYPNPIVNVADVNICKSEECGVLEAIVENLQDVEPVTYLWSDGSTDASIKVCEEGEYCVTVYSKDQCIGTACGNLMFYANPVVSVADLEICENEECGILEAIVENLQDVEPVTYLWSNGSTDASIKVCEEGEYCVTVYSKDQCMGTACGSLKIYPNPLVEVIVAPENGICNGDEAKLCAIVTNPEDECDYSYIWSNGETTDCIVVSPVETTIYNVTVTSCHNCIGIAEGEVIVHNKPIVEVNSEEICEGDPAVTLTASVTNPEEGCEYAYIWSNGAETSSIEVSPEVSTTYCVTVTNLCNKECSGEACGVVTVIPKLRVDCNMPKQIFIEPGDEKQFCPTVTAGENVEYQWLFDGKTIEGATDNCYTFKAKAEDHGKYLCVKITSRCGEEKCCTKIITNCEGFQTFTKGGWGTTCHGGNPGCLRDKYFTKVFPYEAENSEKPGLVIGVLSSGKYLQLTNSQAVNEYLPYGGPSAALTTYYIDPARKVLMNNLVSQLVALKLNVYYSEMGYLGGEVELGSLCFLKGTFTGMNIYQFLAFADDAVSGIDLHGSSLNEYQSIAGAINEGFGGSKTLVGKMFTCNCQPTDKKMDLTNAGNSNEDITVYPNPTTGLLNINIPNIGGSTEISVMNINGQKVYTETVSSGNSNGTVKVDITGQPLGVYIIKVSNDSYVKTIKFILQ